MKKIYAVIIALIVSALFFTGCVGPKRGVKRVDIATSYVEAIFNEDFKSLSNFKLTFQMRMSLFTKAEYKKVKGVFTDACGEFEGIVDTIETEIGNFRIISVVSNFDKTYANINVVFDKSNKIAGVHYVYNRSYESLGDREETVAFGEEYPLEGSLAIPKADEPVPAVIIVHGSGPSDRNGSVAGNAVYLDLAEQLYDNGIASLRYDKRTYTYSYLADEGYFDELTVWEETINDVKLAYEFLVGREDIDPKRIFIAGHSLGGYLMPRIANEIPEAAGFILLAPSSSHLEDLIIRQTEYIAGLDGKMSSQEKDLLVEYNIVMERIKELEPDSGYGIADLLGAPEEYWLDLQDYEPVDDMKNEGRPILVIQGGRDYQVDMSEYRSWLDGLADMDNVEFLLFDDLNHMLATGTGLSNPDEYQKLSQVDNRVGDAMSDFILGEY